MKSNAAKPLFLDTKLEQAFQALTHEPSARFLVSYYVYQHIEETGTLPHKTHSALPCPHCKGWSLQWVVDASWQTNPKSVVFGCPSCKTHHRFVFPKEQVMAWEQGPIEPESRFSEMGKALPFWKDMANLRFQKSPAGYASPAVFYKNAVLGLGARGSEGAGDPQPNWRMGYLLERQLQPIHYYLDGDLGRAVARTLIPGAFQLEDVFWFQPYANFLLPEGHLTTANGDSCPFLAYAVVPSGYHRVLDVDFSVCHFLPHLYVWTLNPGTKTSCILAVPLKGQLSALGFAEGEGAKLSFFRDMLQRVLAMALVGATEPDFAQTIHYREKKVRPRKGRDRPVRLYRTFERSWFTWPERLKPSLGETGPVDHGTRTMPPHNKRGHFQRYHTQKGTVLRWKLPQRCNAHLDREIKPGPTDESPKDPVRRGPQKPNTTEERGR